MAMLRSSQYWDQRAIDRSKAIDAHLDKSSAKLARIYNDAARRVQADIETIYDNYSRDTGIDVAKLKELIPVAESKKTIDGVRRVNPDYFRPNYDARITRLEQIKLNMYTKVKQIYGSEVKLNTLSHAATIKQNRARTAYDIEQGTRTPLGGAFSQLNTRRLDQMLRATWDGQNYSQRIWHNTDKLARDISERIPAGLLAGQSSARLSREIRERFGVGKYEADRLIRTETTYFENQSELTLYDELGVDKYVYVATLDSRTSFVCGELDGQIFDVKKAVVGENYPPMHPNCRSKVRAYLGADFEPTKRRVRNEDRQNADSEPSRIVDYKTYDQWSKEQVKPTLAAAPTIPAANVNPSTTKQAKNLGVEQGDPMSYEEALEGSNPNYDPQSSQWSNNCQRTVPTYEMRRRGFDMTSLPYDPKVNIASRLAIKKMWGKPDFDYQGYSLSNSGRIVNKSASHFVKALKAQPIGARLQVLFKYSRRRTGHTMIMERVEISDKYPHGLRFIDPQSGKDGGSYSLKGKSQFSFIRIDNATIDQSMLGSIMKKRGS